MVSKRLSAPRARCDSLPCAGCIATGRLAGSSIVPIPHPFPTVPSAAAEAWQEYASTRHNLGWPRGRAPEFGVQGPCPVMSRRLGWCASCSPRARVVNVETGDCLTVNGTDSGVCPAACSGNHAQIWTPYYETGSTGDSYEFVNGHTGYYLAAADNELYQTPDKGYQDRWMNG